MAIIAEWHHAVDELYGYGAMGGVASGGRGFWDSPPPKDGRQISATGAKSAEHPPPGVAVPWWWGGGGAIR
jgi:hypothetical protein